MGRSRKVFRTFLVPLFLLQLLWISGAVRGAVIPVDGRNYVPLSAISRALQMQGEWRKPEKEFVLTGRSSRLEFSAESREMRINGIRVFLGEPTFFARGELLVTQVDYEETLRPLLIPQARPPPGPIRTIVVDAGHGGRDQGTRNRELKLLEKDLTLEVAERLKRVLELQGFRVLLVRTDDSYIELADRSAFANAAGADLFVSIHFNAVGNPAVHGTETYILTPRTQRSTGQAKAAKGDEVLHPGNEFDHWNMLLGFLVHRQLLRDLGTFDRGLKRARFQVLRGVECPAVLVEAGYLSNDLEAANARTEEYQNNLVRSLAIAINRYRQATEQVAAALQ